MDEDRQDDDRTETTQRETGTDANHQPYQQVNVTVQMPQPSHDGKRVSKVTYVLLALFLGGIGIHNFYGGHVGLGVLFVMFCWTGIPAVAALVQGVIAICKDSDADGCIYV